MRFFTVYRQGKPIVFSSDMTDKEAYLRLSSSQENKFNNFVNSILAKPLEQLSILQVAWIHKLVLDLDDKRIIDLSPVINMFNSAAAKLKKPKITFERFALEPAKKFSGIVVNSVSTSGLSMTYGKISPDGKFYPSNNIPAFVSDELYKLADDPIGYVMQHGRACGKCCFCNHTLKDDRSLAMGYGSTCAKNYGMAWGKDKMNTMDIINA